MQRFTQHTFYTKLATLLASALLSTLTMHTTQAMQPPNSNITLHPTTVQLLNEYKNYPNWVNPNNNKPFLFALYDKGTEIFLNFLEYIKSNADQEGIFFQQACITCVDAVRLSINTPYNGQSLFIRALKEDNFTIFNAISHMHGIILIANSSLYLTYLNLDYQDNEQKTIGDYINKGLFKGDNSKSYNKISLQWYNEVTNKSMDTKIIAELKNVLEKPPLALKPGSSTYNRIMQEANDIINSKGMLQERNKNIDEGGGLWDALKYKVYMGVPSILLLVGLGIVLYHKKNAQSKEKDWKRLSQSKDNTNHQDMSNGFF